MFAVRSIAQPVHPCLAGWPTRASQFTWMAFTGALIAGVRISMDDRGRWSLDGQVSSGDCGSASPLAQWGTGLCFTERCSQTGRG